MPDILYDFPIQAPIARVFEAVSTGSGLEHWWTERSAGEPGLGAEFELGFGPEYAWRAVLSEWSPPLAIEYRMTRAESEWLGTRVGFTLRETAGSTQVQFYHVGWPERSEHYRTSCFCWAMYLRILRRYLEYGEEVPYARRLEV